MTALLQYSYFIKVALSTCPVDRGAQILEVKIMLCNNIMLLILLLLYYILIKVTTSGIRD